VTRAIRETGKKGPFPLEKKNRGGKKRVHWPPFYQKGKQVGGRRVGRDALGNHSGQKGLPSSLEAKRVEKKKPAGVLKENAYDGKNFLLGKLVAAQLERGWKPRKKKKKKTEREREDRGKTISTDRGMISKGKGPKGFSANFRNGLKGGRYSWHR